MINIDSIGTPALVILFTIELLLSLSEKNNKSRTRDMMTNLFLGCSTIITGFFTKGLALGLYSLAYSLAIFTPVETAGLWIAAFFACDFIHYIYHWLGHKTRLLWAAHITHHSSLHYNLSIGFRINFLHLLYRYIFWTPLCFLGIMPHMILFFESLTAIWNFLIHTERIKKLGIFDRFLNTPSNHRVHHASNPEYLDKNLGGILVIFDHLFGTYQKETISPVYGITHNIHSHKPKDVLFHEYRNLARHVSRIMSYKKKLKFLFSKPSAEDVGDVNSHPETGHFISPLKNAV